MKILLIGDYATDCFMEGDCSRLSPEVPVPVMIPTGGTISPGMGGNVLANLKSLCPQAEVTALFPPVVNMKVRYVDRKTGHHFLRVDEPDQCEPLLMHGFHEAFDRADFNAVIISDYNKGYCDPDMIQECAEVCEAWKVPCFLDTKRIIGPWARGAILKINQHELEHNLSAGVKPWEHVSACIVTNGANGMDLYGPTGDIVHHVEGPNVEVRDGAGCGDTVLAALVVAYLENRFDLKAAMGWADKAGRVAVTKRGVVAVKREDIL